MLVAVRLLRGITGVEPENKVAPDMCRKDGVFESGFSDYLAQQVADAPDDAARCSPKCNLFHVRAGRPTPTQTTASQSFQEA